MHEPRRIDRPECGHWLVRLRRGAPKVPAAILRLEVADEPDNPREDHSSYLAAFIAGDPVSLDEVWHRRGEPISEAEYSWRVADLQWAKRYAPSEAIARPQEAVSLFDEPAILPPRRK